MREPTDDNETDNEPTETDYTLGIYQSIGKDKCRRYNWRKSSLNIPQDSRSSMSIWAHHPTMRQPSKRLFRR